MCYHDGVAEAALSEIGPANGRTEAKITFVPSRQFFAQPRFDFSVIDRYVGEGNFSRTRLADPPHRRSLNDAEPAKHRVIAHYITK
jgi:hypothetical protein